MQVTFLYLSQLVMDGNDRGQDTNTFTYNGFEIMINWYVLISASQFLKSLFFNQLCSFMFSFFNYF